MPQQDDKESTGIIQAGTFDVASFTNNLQSTEALPRFRLKKSIHAPNVDGLLLQQAIRHTSLVTSWLEWVNVPIVSMDAPDSEKPL